MIRNWLIGLVSAVVLALVVFGVSAAAGDDMLVTSMAADPAAVPVVAVVFSVVLAGAAALLVAWLIKRTPRPRPTWYIIAGVVLLLSFAQPFVAAQETSTALWLCLMHIVVAIPLAYFLGRSLPERRSAAATATA